MSTSPTRVADDAATLTGGFPAAVNARAALRPQGAGIMERAGDSITHPGKRVSKGAGERCSAWQRSGVGFTPRKFRAVRNDG